MPEEMLIKDPQNPGWYYRVLGTSNQVPPGQLLMTKAQIDQLRRHLTTIHEQFERLYDPASGDPFAMEIEFKITSGNILAINQARPWVFETASAAPLPTPSTDATLSGLTLSDAPFSFASDTTSYDVNVDNGVDRTTVTPTVNDGGATYEIKLDGVTDSDGV